MVRKGFLSGKSRNEEVTRRFCGGEDGDGHLFGTLHFSRCSPCSGAPGAYASHDS